MDSKASVFFASLRGKRVAVCGLGSNNTPVVRQLLELGALVEARDRCSREQLGDTADDLERAGAVLCLGDGYLDGLENADLILRTPGMKPYLPAFEAARRRSITVTSEMELFFELCPAPIYAVTGSDGKTTTTTVIAGLLDAGGRRVFLGGNIGRPLLPLVEQMKADDAAVVELSSFQLTRMTCSPHVSVVTNVAPNHLDWHTDMAEYIDAKRNIVAHQTSADRAVLNADNAVTAGFVQDTRAQVFPFSRKGSLPCGAWVQYGVIYAAAPGETPVAVMPTADIRLPGQHNVENYLAAFAAVWGEVAPPLLAAFARSFGGVPHRCELARELHGVRWYNDSIGTSPSRTIAGLEAFDKPVILIAGGYDKHLDYAPLGAAAKGRVKHAVLLGATADKIAAALPRSVPVTRVADMAGAVASAAALAQEGDIVFMSPASASFDMYKNFEERGEDFKRLVGELE
ncbi:MAG: UDP-N-acetylmuramoyl-L-alanine--D-glutamate ligase [Oscillospiraceae bacterium]|nr:UDP-N-acetylmuramoyl-L-alanine--D-glutamate ligase [Oscillospiraceae bacterium]